LDRPISCEALWDLISLYVDGEAAPDEAAIVERHVSFCPDCARDLNFLREAATLMAETPQVEPPSYLKQAILAATIYRPTFGQRWNEWRQAARASMGLEPARLRALAGAGIAGVVLGMMIQTMQQPALLGGAVEGPSVAATEPALPVPPIARDGDPSVLRERPQAPSGGGLAGVKSSNKPSGPASRASVTPAPESEPAVATAQPSKGSLSPARPGSMRPGTAAARSTAAYALDRRSTVRSITRVQPHGMSGFAARPRADVRDLTVEPMLPMSSGTEPSGVKQDNTIARANGGNEGSAGTSGEPKSTTLPETGRIVLTANSGGSNAESLVTFADLRSSLRKSEGGRSAGYEPRMGGRSQMWDVYKSHF
jgi:hypothetical protein